MSETLPFKGKALSPKSSAQKRKFEFIINDEPKEVKFVRKGDNDVFQSNLLVNISHDRIKYEDPWTIYPKVFELDGRAVSDGDNLGYDLVSLTSVNTNVGLEKLSRFDSDIVTTIHAIHQWEDQIWLITEYIPCTLAKIACVPSWSLTTDELRIIVYSVR